MNLPEMLQKAVKRYNGGTAILMGERRVSFIGLDEESNRIANALLDLGLKKGDRVAVILPNNIEYVAVYFGIAKAGGVAVLLDTKYKAPELTSLFNDCQPKILFIDADLRGTVDAGRTTWPMVAEVVLVDCGDNSSHPYLDYRDILRKYAPRPVNVSINDDDLVHIAYTSGPTYNPRGVALTHGGLTTEAKIAVAGFRQTPQDTVILFALPLHHAFGMVVIMLTSICSGSRVVILSGLSISSLMDVIERERATMFMAVPFVYGLIVNYAEEVGTEHDLSSLRVCGSAGSALSMEVMDRFQRDYGLTIIDFWGQTESSGHVTCQDIDGIFKHGSVGKVLPGWDLKIVDDQEREVPVNQVGEILFGDRSCRVTTTSRRKPHG